MLVIDDDATMRMLAAEALVAAGFAVETADSGTLGLLRYRELRPDAVLLDVRMPGPDGHETCARIRNSRGGRDIPIVMMTGQDDSGSIDRAYDVGATDFVCKPINYSLLAHRLRYVLRASRAFRMASRAADYDALTGLPSRGYLLRDLMHAIAEATRHGHQLAVMVVDFDSFKRINDSVSNAAGDAVLCQAAERLHGCVRASDAGHPQSSGQPQFLPEQISARSPSVRNTKPAGTAPAFSSTGSSIQASPVAAPPPVTDPLPVSASASDTGERFPSIAARFGADEFVLVFKRLHSQHEATTAAAQALSALRAPYSYHGRELFLSASMGVALYPANGKSGEELLRHADAALAQAKRGGQASCQFFTPEIYERATRRQAIEQELRRAVTGEASSALDPERANRQFQLYFQPKVETHSYKVTGVEALLRWHSPTLGSVSPGEFIPVAEETGLIVPLGQWVLRRACELGAQWQHSSDAPIRVAVNISPRQFREAGLNPLLTDILRDTGFRPDLLELELTEGAVIQNDETIGASLTHLKGLGLRIALDDFGTGYSSLSYLTRFPIDVLKIDRSFVQALSTAQSQSITLAVLALARSLKLDVVAEGVETTQQLAFFEQQGSVQIQGYHFARPMPAAALPAWRLEFERAHAATSSGARVAS